MNKFKVIYTYEYKDSVEYTVSAENEEEAISRTERKAPYGFDGIDVIKLK